jgi:hypothetical protein
MQIHEVSSDEEMELVARERFAPGIARTRPGFRGQVALHELGEAVTLCRSHWGGSLRIVRTDRMATTVPSDQMIFCVQVAGETGHRQHGRFAELQAGSGMLVEARMPYERVKSTESRSLALRFPRELLPLRAAEITEGCARSLGPAAPAMQTLSGYLSRLFAIADDLTAPQRLDAGRAAVDLLAMALRDVTPSVPAATAPPRYCST